ncbi:preprotein translocase subunit SecY, partial [Haloarcula sp. 1CSR25-25]|nr:preprotein translocase subunit SecY [Haloarcula sp. 1CSR25-25]
LVGGVLTTPFLGNSEGIIYTWYLFITGQRGTGPVLAADGLQTVLLQGELLGLVTTILIFSVVVYAESVRVEIPLSNARVKGARGRFPVKLIYASVLPMILVRALQANIQFLGRILDAQLASMPAFLGTYSNGQPTGGLFYFLAPIQSRGDWMWWLEGTAQPVWQILTRVGIDLFVMLVGGAVFAVFWVETTDMG